MAQTHEPIHLNGKSGRADLSSAPPRKLVLFDFDGTITKGDSLLHFLIFYKGYFRFLAGMTWLAPVMFQYLFKLTPNWKAKEKVLRYLIGGQRENVFNDRCCEFAQNVLPNLIRPGALDTIKKYASDGATVAVVTASAENWVAPWCRTHNIECIGTQLEVSNGVITGNICGENCYGPAKVRRIQEQFKLATYQEIIAYGDSSGDREMLALAHRHYYRPFRSNIT